MIEILPFENGWLVSDGSRWHNFAAAYRRAKYLALWFREILDAPKAKAANA